MATVYLSLGTNLGDRAHNLERAVTRLTEVLDALVLSPVYETEPWGLVDQPDFYNLCACGETTLEPRALLRLLKRLERALGRIDGTLWGPRLIDIDLLFYDDQVLDEPALQVPHPRIRGRAFVLITLLDLVEDLHHPALKRSIRSLASEVDASTVRRLARPLLAASAPCDQASEPSAVHSHGLNAQSCAGSETCRSSNRVLL
jgi:2-amino-4-hydroxy-6-hydroxymethyldihydropteridine diphosphokinase